MAEAGLWRGRKISIFANILILERVGEGELERFFLGRAGGGGGGGGGNGVEDYEDGAAFGGGEGGDGRVEVGMGWAGEGEWQVLVGSGVVGGVEEQADELTAIIGGGKKREKEVPMSCASCKRRMSSMAGPMERMLPVPSAWIQGVGRSRRIDEILSCCRPSLRRAELTIAAKTRCVRGQGGDIMALCIMSKCRRSRLAREKLRRDIMALCIMSKCGGKWVGKG